MKNSHFKILTLIAFTTIFLSGCGTTTQQIAQTPTKVVVPTESTTTTQNVAPSNTPPPTIVAPTPTAAPKQNTVVYNLAEVSKHNNANDCWMVIDGKIYNVTSYIPQHPGGPEKIIRNCGKDGTQIFNLKHSPDKKQYLTPYFVANLQ